MIHPEVKKAFAINVGVWALGLCAAWFFDWRVTDLVWQLWFSSLLIGYLTIVLSLFLGAKLGLKYIKENERRPDFKKVGYLIKGGFMTAFLLGFFTIHFVGFHAGHAVFLAGFFPLEAFDGLSIQRIFNGAKVPVTQILLDYLPSAIVFLLTILIIERNTWSAPISKYILFRLEPTKENTPTAFLGLDKKDGKMRDNIMMRPYINVLRMHFMIFVFALTIPLKVDAFIIYTIVYTVYAFPWWAVKRKKGRFS